MDLQVGRVWRGVGAVLALSKGQRGPLVGIQEV